jgi:DNA polymerase III delta prime subunit
MHAFLLVGPGDFQQKISSLAKNLKAKVMEYPLQKIEDARNLNSLVRLSFDEPTLILIPGIHEATEETLNAFLKNLEEPQDNVYFALTAPSTRKVLPTIVSRCQIIRISNYSGVAGKQIDEEIEKFLALTTGEKLNYIDKIKDREKAIILAENTVNLLHGKLHSDQVKYGVMAKNIEAATKTLTGLRANGNVNLQLTNMVINLK